MNSKKVNEDVVIKEFNTKDLLDLGLPLEEPEGGQIISDTITGHGRWSTHHQLIVQLPDQMGTDEAWLFKYSRGSTEEQDESPWQYTKTTKAKLVHRITKMVEVWE